MTKWIDIEDEQPLQEYESDGGAKVVLVCYRQAPECGSKFQTANVIWLSGRGRQQISHWAKISEPKP